MEISRPKLLAPYLFTLGAFALLASVASADSVTVNDFSFEIADVADGAWTGTSAAWTAANGGFGVQDWLDAEFTSATGNTVELIGSDGYQGAYVNDGASIYQDVGTLLANTTYTLTVAVGNRGDKNYADTFELGFHNSIFGTALKESGTLGGTVANFDHDDFFLEFTTGGAVSGSLIISLTDVVSGSGHVVFDNVRLSATAVPEPSAYALLAGLSCLGFVVLRRRRS